MNNNRLVFLIGCCLLVVSWLLLSAGATVDAQPYIIVGGVLVFSGLINEALGE